MTLKNEIKENLNNKDEKNYLRFESSKLIFIFTSLAFFITFYFIWSWVIKNKLENLLSPMYILFLISMNIFVFYAWQKFFKEKIFLWYIISILFFIMSIFFLIPII